MEAIDTTYDIEAALESQFTYCRETGVVYGKKGRPVGFLNKDGYLSICFRRKTYAAHRIALRIVSGCWPMGIVDHINGIKTDNRLCNLRVTNHTVNALNRHQASGRSSSGILGVTRNVRAGTYTARICLEAKQMVVGTYATAEMAREAYLRVKQEEILKRTST